MGVTVPVSTEEAALAYLGLRVVLATILVATLLLVNFVYTLGNFGASLSGLDMLLVDDEDDDILRAAAKNSKKKKRSPKLANGKNVRVEKRPQRLHLLLPLLLAAFSYLAECGILVLDAVLNCKGLVDDWALYPSLGCAFAFLWASLSLTHRRKPEDTEAIHLQVFALAPILVQSFVIPTEALLLARAGSVEALDIVQISMDAIRIIIFSAISLAYLPRFCEDLDAKSLDDEVSTPLLAHENGNGTANGDTSKAKEDEDDDEEEEEEDDRKKMRNYDIIAVVRRIRRLLPYMAPLRDRSIQALVVVCILCALIGNLCVLLSPRQLGIIVSDLVAGRSPYKNIMIWVGLRCLTGWGGLLKTIHLLLWYPVEQRASREMTIMSFEHILNLSSRYHNNKKTGEVTNVIARADSVSDFLEFALFHLFPVIIDLCVGSTYLTAKYGSGVTVVLLATSAGYFFALATTRTKQAQLRSERIDRGDDLSAIRTESLSHIDLVKYFAAERYEIKRYRTAYCQVQRANMTSTLLSRATDAGEDLITELGVLCGALLVARKIVSGQLDIGAFVTFTSYMSNVLSNVQNLNWMASYTNTLMSNTDKLMDLLDEKNEVLDKPDAEELFKCTGHIEFDNVSFSYAGHSKAKVKKELKTALKNVSFTVKPGQHVALVGETGSGKSTLIRLLFRLFDVTEGAVKVDGKDVRDYTQHSLRRAFGVVQQEPALFHDTIMANIKFGDVTASDAKALEAAKAASIYDRVLEWPKKFKTVVGDRGIKLSGGEKQRVSIARALLKNPDVLLLDEATSALDTKTEKDIQAQLRKLTTEKTTIAIAHRLSTISHADLIIVLSKGSIVERGTHQELLTIKDGHYAKLWSAQISGGASADEEDASMAGGSAIRIDE